MRKQRTPIEQRTLARQMRAMVRTERSVTQAAEKHGITRTDYYRLVDTLEVWEAQATHAEQFAELSADVGTNFMDHWQGIKWSLASGKLILEYAQGNDIGVSFDRVVTAEEDDMLK